MEIAYASVTLRFRSRSTAAYREQLQWLQRDADGNHLCAERFPRGPVPKVCPGRIFLPAVALSPVFIGRGSLSLAAECGQIEAVVGKRLTTDRFPRHSVEPTAKSCTVSYDYAFLLMTSDRLGHPAAERLAGERLDFADAAGASSDAYIGGKSRHTERRPWESAINLVAMLRPLRHAKAQRQARM